MSDPVDIMEPLDDSTVTDSKTFPTSTVFPPLSADRSTVHSTSWTTTTTAVFPSVDTSTPDPEYSAGLEGVDLFIPVLIVIFVVIMLCAMIVISKRRRRLARQQNRSDPLRAVSGGVIMNVNAYRNYRVPPPQPLGANNQAPTYPASPAYQGGQPPSYDEVIRQASLVGYGAGVDNLGYTASVPNLAGSMPAPPAYSELPPPSNSSQQPQQRDKSKTNDIDAANVDVLPKPSTSEATENTGASPSGGDGGTNQSHDSSPLGVDGN